MSTSYYIYAAQKINGKYYCINPMYQRDGKLFLTRTMESWSRSYFHETADKLIDIGFEVPVDVLPDELKERFGHMFNGESFPIYVIPLDEVRKCIPDRMEHEFHGIYAKDRIFAYESGDIEYLYDDDISDKDYSKLSDTAKKRYQYYEWDDPMGWFSHFKDVLSHVDWTIKEWEQDYHADFEKSGSYYLILFVF